nr:helix-turn-helix domain-containing protein [Streptomyces sp. F2]
MPYAKPVLTPDWMRLAEAAGQLGCHPDTVRNRITAGTITGVRVLRFDGVLRVHREDWSRYMESVTLQPAKVS